MTYSYRQTAYSYPVTAMALALLLTSCGHGSTAAKPSTATKPTAAKASATAPTKLYAHAWNQLTFKAPVQLSKPTKLGLDAVYLQVPASGAADFELLLVGISTQMAKRMGLDEAGQFKYVKSTFFGMAKAPSGHVPRRIFERASRGEVFERAIPKPGMLETHLVTLPDGSRLVIGFRSAKSFPAAQAEAITTAVCSTLRVTAP